LQACHLQLRRTRSRIDPKNFAKSGFGANRVAASREHLSHRKLCLHGPRICARRSLHNFERLVTLSVLQQQLSLEELRVKGAGILSEYLIDELRGFLPVAGRGIRFSRDVD
jgi:hypothetical protein